MAIHGFVKKNTKPVHERHLQVFPTLRKPAMAGVHRETVQSNFCHDSAIINQ
jgi:hypothetical protein